ncbi:MAG: ATPase, partial [Acidobacteriia bacterium]|nr:ATPase [Terriglobia bacterium]
MKIAADHFKTIKVIATGSSTLSAKQKFRDTLTGRKTELLLTPLNSIDLLDLKAYDLEKRMLHGGLPEFYLSEKPD